MIDEAVEPRPPACQAPHPPRLGMPNLRDRLSL